VGGRADAWRLARDLLAEARRSEALAAREEASRRYNEAKQAVTGEVIAGRLSLAEAAERFALLNGLLDGDGAALAPYQGPVGEQALCANVIVWVSATLPRGSSRLASVQARLEAEYRERFGAAPRGAPPPALRGHGGQGDAARDGPQRGEHQEPARDVQAGEIDVQALLQRSPHAPSRR
jgi:hypothetical protein